MNEHSFRWSQPYDWQESLSRPLWRVRPGAPNALGNWLHLIVPSQYGATQKRADLEIQKKLLIWSLKPKDIFQEHQSEEF
jgi:hypothetical protein